MAPPINSPSPASTDTSKTIAGMADTANSKRCPSCTLLFFQPGEETGMARTSRVEELLRHNHPPLDVELSDFRQVSENTRAVLEDLDARIVQAREVLDNLLSARQQVQSHFQDMKSILHPMCSIPNELLAEIFGHCIMQDRAVNDPDSLDPQSAPWLLTRVCRRWRNLAISFPRLWTYLLLDFDKHEGHISHHQCLYKVCLFIERSRGLPLTVYLGSNKSIKDHPILPVLEASIPRWRYLEVDLPRACMQRLSGHNFLMLQTLFLQYKDEDEWRRNLDVFKLTSAPVLRRLKVHKNIPWRALEHVAFPWSQVTSILSFPAFDPDGLNRLRTTADLEALSVLAGTSAQTPIDNPISLPKLRCLTITESKEASGRSKEFCSILTIPALLELTLGYDDESVLHFPTSSLPLGNLIKLDITCEMNSHEENTQHILDFLTLTHHVESLRLYDLHLTAEFCDGLNLDKIVDGLPARLPCLQFLDIGDCEFAPALDNDIDQLFDMLYSRLPAVTAEGEQDEETADANDSCTVVMDRTGQPAVTHETGTLEDDSRSWLDWSEDQHRYLNKVQIPRRLYIQMRVEWPELFLELTSQAELECAFTTKESYMYSIDS